MAFELTSSGLTIQTLAEVKADYEADFRASFGDNINVAPSSVFGQVIGVLSERETSAQQEIQNTYSAFDPNTAVGVQLDRLGALTGSIRDSATFSTAAGLITGTSGTVVTDGKLVRLIQTGDEWEITGGPYTVPGGGTIACTIQAVEAGAIDALTTGPSGWDIVTTVSGWTDFETTADAVVGQPIQSDLDFETQRQAELLATGDDIGAIRASVLRVANVQNVTIFENRTLVTDALGIPGKALEVLVVDDGAADNDDIAQAIFDTRPPGAKAYGSLGPFNVDDGAGGTVPIQFTRPSDVSIWVSVEVTLTGAEATYPSNGDDLIEAAVLTFAEANHASGDDVIPTSFVGTVYNAINVFGAMRDVTVKLSLTSFGTATEAVIAIDARDVARFDSARIQVVQL
jgi:uncharacterized phage protein gp47/JayE